jgi:enoyl-CoA hydratase
LRNDRAGFAASRIVPLDSLIDESMKIAEMIAEKSLPVIMMIKESVNRAYETTLAVGNRFERRPFYAMFSTQDQKEV